MILNDQVIGNAIFEIVSSGSSGYFEATSYNTSGGGFISRSANGTRTSPTAVLTGHALGFLGAKGYGATDFPISSTAGIIIRAAENWTDSDQGTEIAFYTTRDGTTTPLYSIILKSDGTLLTTGRRQSVTTQSGNYTLTVNDEIVVFTATATATLPAATGRGQTYRICNEGVGTVTIDGNGSDTIKGSLTQSLAAGEDLILSDYTTGKWA